MARTGWSASNYCVWEAGNAPVTDYPLFFSAWVYPFSLHNGWAISLGDSFGIGGVNSWNLGVHGGGKALIRIYTNNNFTDVQTGNSYTLNAWNHIALVGVSRFEYYAYLNGDTINSGGGTTNRRPTQSNGVAIGSTIETPNSLHFNGRIAEVAVWNHHLYTDLTDYGEGSLQALARGVPANRIRPDALVAYWPLLGDEAPIPDYTAGQRALTVTGSLAYAPHSPTAAPFAFKKGATQIGDSTTIFNELLTIGASAIGLSTTFATFATPTVLAADGGVTSPSTVAVADEALLNLTGVSTPDPALSFETQFVLNASGSLISESITALEVLSLVDVATALTNDVLTTVSASTTINAHDFSTVLAFLTTQASTTIQGVGAVQDGSSATLGPIASAPLSTILDTTSLAVLAPISPVVARGNISSLASPLTFNTASTLATIAEILSAPGGTFIEVVALTARGTATSSTVMSYLGSALLALDALVNSESSVIGETSFATISASTLFTGTAANILGAISPLSLDSAIAPDSTATTAADLTLATRGLVDALTVNNLLLAIDLDAETEIVPLFEKFFEGILSLNASGEVNTSTLVSSLATTALQLNTAIVSLGPTNYNMAVTSAAEAGVLPSFSKIFQSLVNITSFTRVDPSIAISSLFSLLLAAEGTSTTTETTQAVTLTALNLTADFLGTPDAAGIIVSIALLSRAVLDVSPGEILGVLEALIQLQPALAGDPRIRAALSSAKGSKITLNNE